jgi:hypothetical protein
MEKRTKRALIDVRLSFFSLEPPDIGPADKWDR